MYVYLLNIIVKHMINLVDENGIDLVGTPNSIRFYPTLYSLFI